MLRNWEQIIIKMKKKGVFITQFVRKLVKGFQLGDEGDDSRPGILLSVLGSRTLDGLGHTRDEPAKGLQSNYYT